MDAPVLVLSAVIGIGVGVLSGMLGIGGGMIMVPLFRLGFAMEAIQATATSLLAIIPTSLAGLVKHIRGRTCIPSLGVAAGAAGAITSPIGVHLASLSPGWLIMLSTATVIAYASISMLRTALAMPASGGKAARQGVQDRGAQDRGVQAQVAQGQGFAPEAEPPTPPITRRTYLTVVLVGLAAGVVSGFVGLAGGFILIPLFVNFLHLPMKKASGTSLAAVCILATPGAIQQMLLGNTMVGIALAMACGSIPGAILGASLVKRLPERTLRLVFGAMLFVAALLLAVNEVIQ